MSKETNKENKKRDAKDALKRLFLVLNKKLVLYYSLITFVLLVFLKLLAWEFFVNLMDFLISFLPMGIILGMAIRSYINHYNLHHSYKKSGYPLSEKEMGIIEKKIRKEFIFETLALLVITLVFYVLYSPSSWAPVLEALGSFGRLVELDNFFLLLAYGGVLYIAGVIGWVAYKYYQKNSHTSLPPVGMLPALIHKLIYRTFIIFFALFAFSALAYPGAYSPITDFVSDTFAGTGYHPVPTGDQGNLLSRLRKALTKTGTNLTESITKTNTDLVTDLKDAKDQLDESITASQKDLKLQLEQQLTSSSVIVEGPLIVTDTATTQDIIPESDTAYDLGSTSKSWNNLYVHALYGASAVTIGSSGSSHGVNSSNDLVVSGDAEVKGTFYADNGIDADSNKIINVANPTADNDAANKTYVDNLVGTAAFLERSGTTMSPVNEGDSLDMESGDISNVNTLTVTTATATNATINTLTNTNATVSGTLTVGTLSGTTGSFTSLAVSSSPSSNTAAANKLYVDNSITTGLTAQDTFLELTDTPSSYSGASGQFLKVSGSEVVFGTIAWDDVLKTGSSLADLATRSAGDLSSGNLSVSRMPTGGSWSLSSDLNIDSNLLYLDEDAGRVGIGTGSPGYKLDVATNIAGDGFRLIGTGGVEIRFSDGIDESYRIGMGATDGKLTIAAGTGQATTFDNTGKVGILTASPNEALEVSGNIRLSGVYKIGAATVLQNPGTYNIFVGESAGGVNNGQRNAFLGFEAGASNTSGSSNTFIGMDSGYTNTTGSGSVSIGDSSGKWNQTGGSNVLIGAGAGQGVYLSSAYSNNTMIGYQAGYGTTTGGSNFFGGYQAGYGNTTGAGNVLIGQEAGKASTAGNFNNALGYQSLYSTTSGETNNSFGFQALYYNTTGSSNNALGKHALLSNTGGNHNNAMGYQSLISNTTGSSNNSFGASSLTANTSGAGNNAMGWQALYSNTTGAYNTGLGISAGYYSQTGTNNLFFGYEAGYGTAAYTGSDYNTIIGYQAGHNIGSNQDYNVFIGYQAGYSETGSSKLYIDNSNTATPLVYGDFANNNLGINTASFGTNAAGVVGLANGTAPTTSPADMVQLYAVDYDDADGTSTSELFVRDEDGNATNLSPHNFSLLNGPSEEMAWSYYSERGNKVINADMTRALRVVEDLSGETLIHIRDKETGAEQVRIASVGKVDEILKQVQDDKVVLDSRLRGNDTVLATQDEILKQVQDDTRELEARVVELEKANAQDASPNPLPASPAGRLPKEGTNLSSPYEGEVPESSRAEGFIEENNKRIWYEFKDSIVDILETVWFHAKVTFEKTAIFLADVTFKGKVTIGGHPANGSEAGIAKIKKSDKKVTVKFTNDFSSAPVVTATASGEAVLYQVKDESKGGFTILLAEDAKNDVSFNWIAQEATSKAVESEGDKEADNPPSSAEATEGRQQITNNENANTNANTNDNTSVGSMFNIEPENSNGPELNPEPTQEELASDVPPPLNQGEKNSEVFSPSSQIESGNSNTSLTPDGAAVTP